MFEPEHHMDLVLLVIYLGQLVYFQNKTAFDMIFQRTKKTMHGGFDSVTAASIEHIVTERRVWNLWCIWALCSDKKIFKTYI